MFQRLFWPSVDICISRAHERNTLSLTLAFLPYHNTPGFANLLAILPPRLPEELKFLHPYVQSAASPSRHTIIYTASNNKNFLSALSKGVLRSCVKGYQYPALVSFWASITTEAIATMLDQGRSTRREAQARNQEDILLFILPILNRGISIKDASELRIGCYMILTVLVSKASLEENVLLALMEAVTSDWERVSHAGLICLAVLAQQRNQYRLPSSVMKALRSLPSIEHDLQLLSKQYEVDRLVLGLVMDILKEFTESGDSKELPRMRRLLESGLMRESSSTIAIDAVLSTIDKAESVGMQISEGGSRPHADLVLLLTDSKQIQNQMKHAVTKSNLPLGCLRQTLEIATEPSTSRAPMLDMVSARTDEGSEAIEDFDSIATRLSAIKAHETSFLLHAESHTYDTLANAFCSMHASKANLERFSDLPVLDKTVAKAGPLFMSFYIRLWCGSSLATVRTAALQTIIIYLENSTPTTFPQVLLPYVFHALSDSSFLVRQAAADLVLVLSRIHAEVVEQNVSSDSATLLPHEQIYGQNEHARGVKWLSAKEVNQVVTDLLVPYLEEYLLDDQAILRLLSLAIAGSKSSNKLHIKACPELKTSRRLSIFAFLCSHVVLSPLYSFKFRMLRVLNQIDKVGSTSRTTLLLPLLSAITTLSNENVFKACQSESIDFHDFLQELVSMVTPHDKEGVQILKKIMQSGELETLNVAALRRMSSIWPRLKPDLQLSVAVALLDSAVDGGSGNKGQILQLAALEAFQAIQTSTAIFQHFLTHLPILTSCSQDQQMLSKRRRTSHGRRDVSSDANQPRLEQDVRRIALVLEKLESSHEAQHPALLKGLFQILADLKDAHSQSGNAMSYLHLLAMDSIFAIVKRAKNMPDLPVDTSAVRMDVLIDYIRTITDPQVRSTAFLLVAGLADIAPEVVLHSVMPIFTHMGANLLRQEDDFSAYVIKQTMDSIIPRLVKSLHDSSTHAFAGVCELLLNFAAAFEHIPQQRRLDIFASLVIKVGPVEYLFALFAILSNKYPGNRRVLDLSSQLFGYQSVQVQLQTMDRCLQLVLDAWDPPSTDSPFGFLLDMCQSAEVFTTNILPLIISVLRSDALRSKITSTLFENSSDANAIRTSIGGILEQVFQLSFKCRTKRRLYPLSTHVVDICLDLLPLQELVMTLEGALTRGNDDLNHRVLQSFVDRLDSQTSDAQAARGPCITFLPQLVKIIQSSTDLTLRQIAVYAVERIVDKFGKTDVPSVVRAAQSVAAEMCLITDESTLRVASLQCLVRMIEVSAEAIVPVIPSTLPGVGQNLELSISQNTENRSLHNACYEVYQALLHYVPRMITGPDLVRILELSYESANAEMGADCDLNRKTTLQIIARQVEVKELLTTLEKTWTAAVVEGPKAVGDHFEVLRLAVDSQPKAIVKQQSEALGDLLIKAFSLRQAQLCPRTDDSYKDDEIEEAEAAINDTAIAIIYKLNDASFRPMFRRLLEWATSMGGDRQSNEYRRTTWYTFLNHFFTSLKSIVTSYAGLIIEDAVDLLGQDVRPGDQDYMRLWRKVVHTLHSTFEHDQDGE